MKLSLFKTGEVYQVQSSTIKRFKFYIVATSQIEVREIRFNDGHIEHLFNFCTYKLFEDGKKSTQFFIDRITVDEIIKDNYPVKWIVTPYPIKDLPLLVNRPHKTKWYKHAMDKNIKDSGRSIHQQLLIELHKRGLHNDSEIQKIR